MFNAPTYFRDHRIGFTDHGAKSSVGWINLHCPFCRSHKEHLGFNLEEGHFHCWKCGFHPVEDVVMALERCEYHEACRIVQEYEADFEYRPPPGTHTQAQGTQGPLEWPPGTVPLQEVHKNYLASRGFDPDYLEAKYGLMGTVNAGPYAARVMVPIIWQGQMVSYQGRLMVRGEPKYKACVKDKELIHHKHVLYNLDNAGNSGVVVEGVFDAWRLGDGAVATFGTSMDRSSPQILHLAGKFRRVFVMFDAEAPAQRRARWLRDQLSALGVEAVNVALDKGDPGDMGKEEAQEMKRRLLNA
jgi:DNA primase